jgi:hypothetical protein
LPTRQRRLEELRKTLATNGISHPMWCEVPKSRFVPEQVEKLLKRTSS